MAAIQTSIDIPASGTVANLMIDFLPGSVANFRFPDDGTGTLVPLDMNGWRFGVAVNLNLASYGQGKVALPQSVDQELRHFSDSMLDVRHLFLDLDSVQLATADPALVKVSDPRPPVLATFVAFMHFYLADLKRKGNPFVLGSTVLGSDKAALQAGNGQAHNVPDLLLPVGMTYALYRDAAFPGRSCLCYSIVTRGGHGTVSSPPNLVANPIRSDQVDGVIAFSHAIFLEPLILRPMFENLRDSVYQQIRNILSLDPQACQPAYPHVLPTQPWGSDAPPAASPWGSDAPPAASPWGDIRPAHMTIGEAALTFGAVPVTTWTYPVAALDGDDDRYNNQYTVTAVSGPDGTAVLHFTGTLQIFKQHTTSFGFLGKAQAWKNTRIDWSAAVAISAENSADGVAIVVNSQSPPPQVTPSSGENAGASFTDALDAVGNIAVGLSQSPLSIFNIFNGLDQVSVTGIGRLGSAVNALGMVARTSFVMPAGSAFFASAPHIDPMGNYQLNLTARR